jgi:prepilin-type N-terminal cleavage/methylation domain-containing protein/prepilin-type processing-associated H-X9-DG protein
MNIPPRQRGFTLMELLITISIVAVVAALLFPVFGTARKAAQNGACASNLRQIFGIAGAWSMDNDGYTPQGRWFVENLPKPYKNLTNYGLTKSMTICPASGLTSSPTYGINAKLVTTNPQWGEGDVHYYSRGLYKTSLLTQRTVFFAETAKQSWSGNAGAYISAPEYYGTPHLKKGNILYADGHIESHDALEMKPPAVWIEGLP